MHLSGHKEDTECFVKLFPLIERVLVNPHLLLSWQTWGEEWLLGPTPPKYMVMTSTWCLKGKKHLNSFREVFYRKIYHPFSTVVFHVLPLLFFSSTLIMKGPLPFLSSSFCSPRDYTKTPVRMGSNATVNYKLSFCALWSRHHSWILLIHELWVGIFSDSMIPVPRPSLQWERHDLEG